MSKINSAQHGRLKKFLSYYKPYKKIFALDMFFAVIAAFTALLFPLISGYITREVLMAWTDDTLQKLIILGLVMLLLLIVKTASTITFGHWGHAMGAKMEGDMRTDLFSHFGNMSLDFFAQNSVGKLMSVLSNDLTNMTELFHHGPEDILMTAIKFFGAFIILIQINVPLTLIVFSVFPFLCVIAFYADKKMQKSLLTSKALLGDMNSQLEDTLSGIRTVKAFGGEWCEKQKFYKKNLDYVDSRCYFYKVEAYFYETLGSYPQLLTMLVVFFGALLTGNGIDLAVLVTFLLYINCLYEPVQIMINFLGLYENGKSSFSRFMNVVEQTPLVTESARPVEIGSPCGDIIFDDVTFKYSDGTENVLENISLHISHGEKLAIVGSSGIGKSTLSYLIARFYDVTHGSIRIGGVDVRDISLSSLRKNIGIVQQEVYIFSGTIRDNICYGCPNATDEEIATASALVGAHSFISQLEHGYHTVLGTKGITLSGGQRQRISLARALLKSPEILILDEATSALDSENEQLVQSAMSKLMHGRTSIIIAHRLSTIKDADRIIVIKDRQIVQHGTHDELMVEGGEYSKLYNIGTI